MSDALPTQYFYKELISNPFYIRGKAVAFDPIGSDIGIIETSDPQTIIHLANAASSHTAGVIEITKERYDELKKNVNSTSYAPPLDRIKQFGLYLQPNETQHTFKTAPDLLASVPVPVEVNTNPVPVPNKQPVPVAAQAPIRPVRRGRIVKR